MAAEEILPDIASTNVEIVRRMYEDWARGDFRDRHGVFAEDVVFVSDFATDRATARGLDAMNALWAEQLHHWTDFRTGTIHELRDLGDTVLVINSLHATGHRSGVAVEIANAAALFRFFDKRIRWLLATDEAEKAERALADREWARS